MVSSTILQGQKSESLAATYLIQQGYRILEKNYRCGFGEIDIIAEEGNFLCFIEVRSTRSNTFGEPIETIRFAKQTKLIRTARHYLMTHQCHERMMRFDVVGVTYHPKQTIQLIRGAFEASWEW